MTVRTPAIYRFCLTALLVLACSQPERLAIDGEHRAETTPADGAALPGPYPDAEERRALYQELISAVRKYHVFSAQTAANLGLDWEDSLKRLEPFFIEAQDLPSLREVLDRLAGSLHDVHLGYDPGLPGEPLRLGLTLEESWPTCKECSTPGGIGAVVGRFAIYAAASSPVCSTPGGIGAVVGDYRRSDLCHGCGCAQRPEA